MTKKTKVPAKKLKGFQDKSPENIMIREHIIEALEKEAHLAGFQKIDTPSLEYAETLLGEGGETDKQVYQFLDNGKRQVALRYDLTVPFARYVAEHQGKMNFPFKRLQMGQVFRAEKPQKGRYREFAQCDLDIIGTKSLNADMEVMACFLKALDKSLPFSFTMILNHRVLLSRLICLALGEEVKDQEQEILIILDKLIKIGPDKVLQLLEENHQCSPEKGKYLLELLQTDVEKDDQRKKLEASLKIDEQGTTALKELLQCGDIIKNSIIQGSSQAHLRIDLSVARGLGYYTGIVFETVLDENPSFGSICSGGRYDQLTHRFSQNDLPGVGGSLGIDRLTAFLEEHPNFTLERSNPSVFIAVAHEGVTSYGFQLTHTLREEGIPCEINLKPQKIGNQFRHAHRLGFPFVVTVGEQEEKDQTFRLKNMLTGDEIPGIEKQELVKIVRAHLETL